MLHTCPRCNAQLNTRNSYDYHMLSEEGCYPSTNDRIVDTIKARINSLRGQVEFILLKEPGARGDDTMLENWHKVFFQHTHYYSAQDQAFHEKQGLQLKNAKYAVKNGSLSRLRRFIQEDDKAACHKSFTNEKGQKEYLPEWTTEHVCLLPRWQTSLRRGLEQQESRRAWVKML